jgi:hypothetical protein
MNVARGFDAPHIGLRHHHKVNFRRYDPPHVHQDQQALLREVKPRDVTLLTVRCSFWALYNDYKTVSFNSATYSARTCRICTRMFATAISVR